jgi:peptide/nickel transport system substrate-binding protein
MVWDQPTAGYAKLFEAILPKHVLEGKDIVTYDGYNRSPLGTGPFMFKEWKAGEYVRVVRNPNYWRGTQYPYLDEIVFQFIPDNNTKLNAIKAGEQQWAQITTTQIKEVKDLPGYKIDIAPQNSWIRFDTSIGTDRGKKLFGDKNVRQALAYAIDRKNIADKVMEGTVQVADTVVPVSSIFYDSNVPKYDYNPAKAKELLAAAGWKAGSDGILTKDGEKFSFEILYRAGRTDRAAVSQVIQANLKDIGIDVKVTSMDNAALTKQWRTTKWEATVSGWTLPADPSFTNLFACKGANNMTAYCDEDLDKLMVAADQALDANARKPLMFQAQEKLMDDMFSLPVFNNVAPVIYTDKLVNFKNSGTNLGPFWNVYEWYLSK